MSPNERFNLINIVVRHPVFCPEAVCYFSSIIYELGFKREVSITGLTSWIEYEWDWRSIITDRQLARMQLGELA